MNETLAKTARLGAGAALALAVAACAATRIGAQQGRGAALNRAQGVRSFHMENRALGIRLTDDLRGAHGLAIRSRIDGTGVLVNDPFSILLTNGGIYSSQNMVLEGAVSQHRLTPKPAGARAADGQAGEQIDLHLKSADSVLNADWIGGDPTWLQVYGWASWVPARSTPAKGIVTLRNPSDHAQAISLKLQDALELPPGAAQMYMATSPWKSDVQRPAALIRASQPHVSELAPFEVLTLELKPR